MRRVGVGGGDAVRRVAAGDKIIAVINSARGQVGDHQIEIVDEFDGGGGIPRRIGPRQRDAQRLGRIARLDNKGPAVAGGQHIGRALVEEIERRSGIGQILGNGIGQLRQAPALIIDSLIHRENVAARHPRAIDEHGLEQGRAGRKVQRVREEILHQRQRAGHRRRRLTGAIFIAVIRPQLIIHALQHLTEIPVVVGRDGGDDQIVIHRNGVGIIRDEQIQPAAASQNVLEIIGAAARRDVHRKGRRGEFIDGPADIGIRRNEHLQRRKRRRRKKVGRDVNAYICGVGRHIKGNVTIQISVQQIFTGDAMGK